jgi:transposase
MKFIQGHNRTQTNLFPVSLDQSIDPDNEVRIIDLFVESLSVKDFGFRMDFPENGRPAYHPSDLLKLFIYGYLNKIRSSRDLEKECGRNIEVMWLLNCLRPDHNTINNFRRDNEKAIKKVFRATVQVAKHFELIGGKLIAGDSTKLRAQNSKKNNFNQAKIDRHIAYIDNKIEEYTRALAENDGDNQKIIKEEIRKHQERKEGYRELEKKLQESGESQISLSDPESRQIAIRGIITEVAYNVQTTVDAKNNIPIDYKVTNENDSKAMGNMVQRAKSILRTNDFTVLYDKGFHTGSELKTAQELGVETIVAVPDVPNEPGSRSCLQLRTFQVQQGGRYIHLSHGTGPSNQRNMVQAAISGHGRVSWFKQYKTKACRTCPAHSSCTKSKDCRLIRRSEYADYYERNLQNTRRRSICTGAARPLLSIPTGP